MQLRLGRQAKAGSAASRACQAGILGALLFEEEGPKKTSPNWSCEADYQSIIQRKKGDCKKIVANGPKSKQAADEKQPPPALTLCQPRKYSIVSIGYI